MKQDEITKRVHNALSETVDELDESGDPMRAIEILVPKLEDNLDITLTPSEVQDDLRDFLGWEETDPRKFIRET